jgi:hypothetical protein
MQVQGQTKPVALTTTVRDSGDEWIVHEAWDFSANVVREIGVLEKDTLFLRRHTTIIPAGTLRELEVGEGRITGWEHYPGCPDPPKRYSIEAPGPIFPWGAGGPQVIATLPLEEGFSTTIWSVQLPDVVVSRTVKVVGAERLQVPAGTFDAWKVALSAPGPDRRDETVWIDIPSHRVLRYDGAPPGPGPTWTVTLQP